MEAHTFLIQIVLILFSARILGELAAYWGVPAVVGELMAGVIIGPSMFGWLEPNTTIQLLANIGVILLLFEVGIETDITSLTSSGANSLLVACGGVVFPFVGGFLVSYYLFDFSALISLFIGATLTATSIGITIRVLRDLKKQNTRGAQVVLGAAVLDDIIGIILLAMLYEFATNGEVNIWNAGKVLVFIVLFFLISPLLVKWVSMTIKKWEEKSDIPGLLPTTIVAIILLFSWIAYKLGAPKLLGGFAAGLALSKQFFFPMARLYETPEFSRKVERQMKPIVHLFTPIFFVSIGLSLNLKTVEWNSLFIWLLTGSLFVVAFLGKFLSGFLLVKESLINKLAIGTSMIPRGEVGLIFANIGLTTGAFNNELYAAMVIIIALTTFIAPFMLRYIYQSQPEGEPETTSL